MFYAVRSRRTTALLPLVVAAGLVLAPSAAARGDKPFEGKVLVFLAAATHLEPGMKEADVDDSLKDIRTRLKGLKWVEPAESADVADIVISILGPRHDPDKGYVIRYTLDVGDEYHVQDDFAFARTLELNSGDRAMGSQIRGGPPFAGTKKFSWDELARQFDKALDDYARKHYELLMAARLMRPKVQAKPENRP